MRTASIVQLFGAQVRKIRTRKGWSVKELAAHTSFTIQRLHAMEAGRGDPTLRDVVRVARALGVRPSVIVRPCDVKPEVSRMKTRRTT